MVWVCIDLIDQMTIPGGLLFGLAGDLPSTASHWGQGIGDEDKYKIRSWQLTKKTHKVGSATAISSVGIFYLDGLVTAHSPLLLQHP